MSSPLSEFLERFPEKTPRLRVRRGAEPAVLPRRTKTLSLVEAAIDDARRRATTGEWENSKGSTFVGLYSLCHQMVYGVVPGELLDVPTFRAAAKHAARALHELFADDPAEVASFIRWTWEAEKRKNTWAQKMTIDRKRLGWKAQFSRSVQTDYQIAQKQRRR